jgi:hypothetical protein
MRIIWSFLLFANLSQAAPETAEDWIKSLTETYRNQGGYIATYHSEGENKTLDATLASDLGSGMAVLHVIGVKNGQRMENRQWNDLPGDFFIDVNGQRGCVTGWKEEMKALKDVLPGEGGEREGANAMVFTPGLLLDKAQVGAELAVTAPAKPGWADKVVGAKLGEVNGKSVVLISAKYGELTISRESGLITRQSVAGEDGEERVLELVDYRKNPGEDAVITLSKDWEIAGAKPLGGEQIQSTRVKFFQDAIDAIEEENLMLADFKEQLDSRKTQLRALAALCFRGSPDSKFAKIDWAKLFKQVRTTVRDAWEKQTPETERDEQKFEAKWEEGKDVVIKGFVTQFEKEPNWRKPILIDIFGPDTSLKARTDSGKKAREFIETAICHAYLEVILQQKADKFWTPSEKAK